MTKRTNRQDRKVIRTRNTIIAGVAAVVIVVLGYGTLYSTGVTDGEYVEGTHYEVIENARGRRPGEPIRVTEYFSYGCIHCRNFDPMIEDWRGTLPDGVRFERVPVAFSPLWTLLAGAYLTLDELDALEQNHERLFRAIHDQGRQFLSAEMLADFVDGHGTTREDFLRVFDSPAVQNGLRRAEREQRDTGIASVPTLVVAGRFRVTMDVGRKTALDVTDHLIAMEQNAAAP